MKRKGGKSTQSHTESGQQTTDQSAEVRSKVWGKPIVKSNELFEEYYRTIGVVAPEEYDEFLGTLRKGLPTAFRVIESGQFAKAITEQFEHAGEKLPKEVEAVKDFANVIDPSEVEKAENVSPLPEKKVISITPPTPLPFGKGGWTFAVPRGVLRRSAELAALQAALSTQSECGVIARQEAVSMIPPLFLDLDHDGLFALDMCAAPGSKTCQIVEKMSGNGCVIANDSDVSRCHLLVNRVRKIGNPRFLVTACNAEGFPLHMNGKFFAFDRILCDVPCSGDGTLRKNPDLWGKWTPRIAFGQHKIQQKIVKRAALLLRPGGRLVYSTCSMNPIEDEAVVAEILRFSNGSLRLVDATETANMLHLHWKSGVDTWRVFLGNSRKWIDNISEAKDEEEGKKLCETMFPPSEEEKREFHLERCMRFLPHLMDTGGFFVAVFEKVKPLDDEEGRREKVLKKVASKKRKREWIEQGKPEAPQHKETVKLGKDDNQERVYCENPEKDGTSIEQQSIPQHRNEEELWKRSFGEDPLVPIDAISAFTPIWQSICEFYGLSEAFLHGCVATRKRDCAQLLWIPREARAFAELREIKIINAGVKIFERQKRKPGDTISGSDYDLSGEGLQFIMPYLSEKRIIPCEKGDIVALLSQRDVSICSFASQTQEKLRAAGSGGAVFKESTGVVLSCHVGRDSCRLLAGKEERSMLRSIFCPEAFKEEIKQIEDAQREKAAKKKQREEKFKEDQGKKEGELPAAQAHP